jgi:hypothetical protein
MVTVRTRFVPGRCALLELIEVLPLSGGSSSPTSRLATGDPSYASATSRPPQSLASFRDGAPSPELGRDLVEHGIEWHALSESECYASSLTAWCCVGAFRSKGVKYFPRCDCMPPLDGHDNVDLLS